MPRIEFIHNDGSRHIVDAPLGRSLMEVAVDHLMPGIAGDCGGSLSCASCHAYLEGPVAAALARMDEDEEMILENATHVRPDSRLTCQIDITPAVDGLVVRLPPGAD